jgi:hypothetical protein
MFFRFRHVAIIVGCFFAGGIAACDRIAPSSEVAVEKTDDVPAAATAFEVRIGPESEAERVALITRFRRANGHEFAGVERADPNVDDVRRLVRIAAVQDRGRIGTHPDPDDVDKVRKLLRANARLLGIAEAEVAAVHIEQEGQGRQYRAEAVFPRRGYERFPSVARRVRLTIGINDGGEVVNYIDSSDRLPPFAIRTDPRLKPGDPALLRNVVGRTFSFGDIGGRPRTAGPVKPEEISTPELTILVSSSAAGLVLRLAYVVHVTPRGLLWDVFVDPETGEFLEEHQRFET